MLLLSGSTLTHLRDGGGQGRSWHPLQRGSNQGGGCAQGNCAVLRTEESVAVVASRLEVDELAESFVKRCVYTTEEFSSSAVIASGAAFTCC